MNILDKINYKLFGFQPTYAQCGEDIILAHFFRSLKMDKITYLDIGTNDPIKCNNTYLFYKNGSSGVCVEPNPKLYAKIKSKRSRDICLNKGVGLASDNELDFFVLNPHTLSTFCKIDAENLSNNKEANIDSVIKISIIDFNNIIEIYFENKCPDLVSIDVEGLNEEIVNAIDLSKNRPKAFCLETIKYSNTNHLEKIDSITNKMIFNNYIIYADTYLNTIFIDNSIIN